MGSLANAYSIFEALGGFTTLILLLLSVSFYLVRSAVTSYIEALTKRLDKFEQILMVLEHAALSEEGQAVSQAKQLNVINQISDSLDKHAEKCLSYHESLFQAHHDLSELRADIERFTEDGKEARKLTQETVSKLGDRLDNFMERILEVIRNLSDFGARRGN